MPHPNDDPHMPAQVDRHSRALADRIRREAAEVGGLLPFDRFMELALYAPGLGYYVGGAHKLGAAGDFVTAPEISPLFGRCIARQIGEVLAATGGGEVLELGAGTGAMAAEILSALATAGAPPARYRILEPSPDLRERQRALLAERIPGLLDRVEWLQALPRGLTGAVVANEVLDAMPVHRFSIRADGSPGELFVRPAEEGWEEVIADPVSPGLTEAVRALQAEGLVTRAGFTSEINLRLGPWLAAMANALARGMLLLVDYGYPRAQYYRAERSAGTLMCHSRHRAHPDPYLHPGLQDITAHVDFSAVATGAREAGLALAGYTTQAHFLLGCGLEQLLAEAAQAGDTDTLLGAKQLVLPQAMGERFQAMALTKQIEGPWCGFSVRDLRGRL